MFISGWSLNTEYFTEIMHLLRSPAETMRYRGLVESLVEVSAKSGDTSGREQEAIMRLCTAYLKLFFPHADASLIKDIKFKQEFDQYCLSPAKRMQETVLRQMKIINPGMFGNTGFATYKVRYSDTEQESPSSPQMRERMVINEE
jgi:ATP-dependent Lon protease